MDSSTTPMAEDAWTPNGNGEGNGEGNGGAAGLMDKAREQIQPVVSQAQQKAGEAMGQATDQVKSQLASQKDRASDSLQSVAEVLRQTGQSLREQQYDSVGQYADTAADQVERIAGYIRERNVDELVGQAQDFARSQPALILGATFALGFLAARLIKNAETGGDGQQGYSPGATSGSPDPAYARSGYSDEGNPNLSISGSTY